jgi:hypothetical protein
MQSYWMLKQMGLRVATLKCSLVGEPYVGTTTWQNIRLDKPWLSLPIIMKVRIGERFYTFSNQNYLKQWNILSPLILTFKLVLANRNFEESSGSEWNILSIYLPMYLCIYLSIYGSTAVVDLGRFFSFLIHIQFVGHLGRRICRRKDAVYTEHNTNTE